EKRKIYDSYGEEGLKNGFPSQNANQPFFHDPNEIFMQFFRNDPFLNNFFNNTSMGFDQQFFQNQFIPPNMQSRAFNHNNNMNMISTTSYSTSSYSGGSGGRGTSNFVSTQSSTQIVNGVRTTVTKTVDAEGNVTVIKESSDGTRHVTVNGKSENDLPRHIADH
ncbi:834_t:CDS:2, partial [Entrophospora sp. SA101]